MPRRSRESTLPPATPPVAATEAGAPSQWGNLTGGPAHEQAPDPLAGWRTLPPPGDARNEELRRRKDELDQKRTLLAEQLEIERINPEALKPDYNVRSESYADKYGNLDMDARLKFSHPQPGFKYAWVNRDPHGTNGNWQTHEKEESGWQVVTGDMPEAHERMAVTGARWNQDCHLMRIPLEKWEENEGKNRRYRQWRETGVSPDLIEMHEKHGNNVFTLHDAPPALQAAFTGRLTSRGVGSVLNTVVAQRLALQNLDRHIRAGTLGIPMIRR